jgi:coatomer protein complex subunit gamma
LLRLISRGDVLTPNECQDVFFGSTKLFQCPDERLRRMLYLLIKELKPSADIVFIVTASLNKDMTGSNDNFRSNALRVMCQITDAQMLLQVERFIKQACVDKQAAVSSAALVSGLQLLKKNNDSVKRWQNEVAPSVCAPLLHGAKCLLRRRLRRVSNTSFMRLISRRFHLHMFTRVL